MKNLAQKAKFVEVHYGHALVSTMEVDPQLHDHFRNNRFKLDQRTDPVTGNLIYQMLGYFLEYGDPHSIKYRRPLTWWDHLKKDHFPKWWLKRWPARELEQEVVIKDIFPFPHRRFPDDLGQVIRFAEPLPVEFYPDKEWSPRW